MIDADTIRASAANLSVDPGIIEKDYVLSKVLMSLGHVDLFSSNLLFKGGTALKKCYYPNWRFSADIDLTAVKALEPKLLKALFQEAVEKVGRLFGLSMRVIEYSQYPKSNEELISAALKLGYDGPLRKSSGQKNNIRVDIAFDEVIVSRPITKAVIISYTDDIEAHVRLYPLEEIAAEKLRSILQRGKSRDYYDVWALLKDHSGDFSSRAVHDILLKKCQHVGIPAPSVSDFFRPERTDEAARFWERGLAHQVTELPDFDGVLEELKTLIDEYMAR